MSSGFVSGGTIHVDELTITTATSTDPTSSPPTARRHSASQKSLLDTRRPAAAADATAVGDEDEDENVHRVVSEYDNRRYVDDNEAHGGSDQAPALAQGKDEYADEWTRVQSELEDSLRRNAESTLKLQHGGREKSLYEILQDNKQAKQDAFEESIRLKNQFRALDPDEAEFLDSVLESTRAHEAAVKKETAEQLAVFHRQRELADKVASAGEGGDDAAAASPTEEEVWFVSARKRKRGDNKKESWLIPGKLRKSSSSGTAIPEDLERKPPLETKGESRPVTTTGKPTKTPSLAQPTTAATITPISTETKPSGLSLGLVGYNSEDDSD